MRMCWPQWTMVLVVLILGVSSMLSGCGKKGPLYVPGQADSQEEQQQNTQQTK